MVASLIAVMLLIGTVMVLAAIAGGAWLYSTIGMPRWRSSPTVLVAINGLIACLVAAAVLIARPAGVPLAVPRVAADALLLLAGTSAALLVWEAGKRRRSRPGKGSI